MKTIFKKLIIVIMIMVGGLMLVACKKGSTFEINAHTDMNLVHEFILIKTSGIEDETTLYDWYVKEDGHDDWVLEKENWNEKLYYTAHHESTYEVKAVAKNENKDLNSNVITISFIENYGTTFGMSPLGDRPSRNIDYAHDNNSAEKHIIHGQANKVEDEYTYFKEIYGTRYVISAQIDIIAINGSDPYPKSGLIAAQFSDRLIYFAFDARPSFDWNDIVVVNRSGDDGGKWEWPGTITSSYNVNFRSTDGGRLKHRLTVIRDLTTFYFLVDDNLILTKQFPDLTFETVAGTYTMAQSSIFSNYYAYMDDPDNNNDFYDQMLIEVRGY